MNKTHFVEEKMTFRVFLLIAMLLINFSNSGLAEGTDPVDQVSINLNVQQLGSIDISSLIVDEHAYLPVKELFDFLRIRNAFSDDFNTVQGSIIDPKATFEISVLRSRITFRGKVFSIKASDLIRTEGEIYLKTELFGQIFGLNCIFKFRSLSISLTTQLQLPAIRDLKLAQMRKNISSLNGEKKADTMLKNQYPLFDLGAADWSFTASQDNFGNSNTRANLILGGIVAGGQAIANLNYNTSRKFNARDQYFQWKYVNNDQPLFKQINAGRIFTQSISSIYNPINGIQISNTPTTYRRSFGSFRINSSTEPGWLVELYVNDVLVNFTTADASGFYSFDVPLVYGNSVIKKRFYGPLGEERMEEQNVNIPFNFLPTGKVEYTLTAGIVDNSEKDIFLRAAVNYGLNNHVTIGGGTESLSGVNAGNSMAFINSSVRIVNGLLASGQFTPGINSRAILNYQLPGNLQLDITYIKYAREQTAIRFNYLEERKIELSIPIRSKFLNAYSRFAFNQFVLEGSKISNAQFMTSAILAGIGTNFSTNMLYTNPANPYIFSNLSLSFRLPMNLRFSPHIQYEYKQQYVSSMKAELEKRISRFGFATLGYEKNVPNKISTLSFALKLNLSFAQTYFAITQGDRGTLFSHSAFGSLLYNSNRHSVSLTNQTNVGRGELSISAFLDLNRNGMRDRSEPRVSGLKLKINGGRITRNLSDTTISVSGLEANADYILQLNPNSFENISWKIKNKVIAVTTESNHYKSIEIPVNVTGEASGYVFRNQQTSQTAMAGIIVEFYTDKSILAGKTLTESDGYFTFMDLSPGKYSAKLNDTQLQSLKLKSEPPLPFEVKMSKDGDIIDGLDFHLQNNLIIKEPVTNAKNKKLSIPNRNEKSKHQIN